MRDPRDRTRKRLFSRCDDPETAEFQLSSSMDRFVSTEQRFVLGERLLVSFLDEDSGLMIDVDAIVVARSIAGILVRAAPPVVEHRGPTRAWPVPTRFVPAPTVVH